MKEQNKESRSQKPTKETKSRRVQLLMKPSWYKLVLEESEKEERSFNDMINRIIAERYGVAKRK